MRLNEIYRTYKDRIDFYCAYIKEAHPEDSDGGYRSEHNAKLGILIDQPTTIDQRAEAAEVRVKVSDRKFDELLSKILASPKEDAPSKEQAGASIAPRSDPEEIDISKYDYKD